MPTFAEQIRDHRENAGLSQSAVSRRLGIDSSLISRFENGKRVPKRDLFYGLVRIYDVSGPDRYALIDAWLEADGEEF